MLINCSRNIWLAYIALFLSFPAKTFSQQTTGCDLIFINHLVNKANFEEALFLLDSGDCLLYQTNDSANFLRGWSLYSLNRFGSSAEILMKITPGSSFYLKSHFYAAYNFSLFGNLDNALETLEKIEMDKEGLFSLKNYEIAGIKLLQGDIPSFEELLKKTDRNDPGIAESSKKLLEISADMKNHKSKSPFLAGMMSGIIPGSGKLYAGRKGESLSAFLSTVGLGLVTWENYRKNGLNNFMTIAFGTAFTVSYVANIWGSVFTVRIIETGYEENVKSTILFNLHIPLRNTFSK
jgi:hypothetical protein